MQLDTGNVRASRDLLGNGLSLAQETGSQVLVAWALSRLGELDIHEGNVERALAYTGGAAAMVWRSPPRARSFILAKHALALSMTGDRGGTLRVIGTSRGCLEKAGGSEEPAWMQSYGLEHIRHDEARCLGNLGMGDAAVKAAEESMRLRRLSRPRAFSLATQAIGHLQSKDKAVDRACEVGGELVAITSEIASDRVRAGLAKVLTALHPYRSSAAVRELAAARPVLDARLLHRHSNASFVLPSAGLVVRIATNPEARDRVAASIAVTRWPAGRGFPCVIPAGIDGQPLVEAGRVVSAWRYMHTKSWPPPTGAELGRLLRDLHGQPAPPCPLRQFADPFASVASAMTGSPDAMPEGSRSWLSDRISQLRDWWPGAGFPRPPGLIHGDAHPGNLLRIVSGEVILGDWDHVAIGPREWDLVQVHYVHRRFGRVTGDDVEAFTAAYGWDIRDWPWLSNLIAVREITGLSPYIRMAGALPCYRRQLAYRLDTLRCDDLTARWESPPRD